jgi:DNA-binding response OmpR family regulator
MSTRTAPLILIVDDDSDGAAVIASPLRDNGYEVLIAHDGAEGLAIATTQHPDLVLLDVVMPGLDGHGVLTQLRRRRIPTRVIVYTESPDSSSEVARLMKAGACAYIARPSPLETVLSQVERSLAEEPPLDQSADGTASELVAKVAELEAKVRRLEHERSSWRERAHRSRWISVGYLAVAVLATYVLRRANVVTADVALVVQPVVLFLMLLLPIGKVERPRLRDSHWE